jgi:AcrR family transcriptional regulator
MPIAFSETERQTIRARLMDAARLSFAERGVQGTSLASLTDAAGVSKSSFYAFFSSKEALYLELLGELAPGVEARVVAPVIGGSLGARDALHTFLQNFLAELEAQPLLRRTLEHPHELRAVAERVGLEELEAKARALAPLHAFVARLQAAGELRASPSPEVVVGALRTVLVLSLHADTLAPHHAEIMALLIDLVATGLTNGAERA